MLESMSKRLEDRFHEKMIEYNNRAEAAVGKKFPQFRRMIAEYGGVQTAKKLVNSTKPSDGYSILWEFKRLSSSSEALMLEDEWKELFTAQELEKATKRLNDCQYFD